MALKQVVTSCNTFTFSFIPQFLYGLVKRKLRFFYFLQVREGTADCQVGRYQEGNHNRGWDRDQLPLLLLYLRVIIMVSLPFNLYKTHSHKCYILFHITCEHHHDHIHMLCFYIMVVLQADSEHIPTSSYFNTQIHFRVII